jgi:hypothetical protein
MKKYVVDLNEQEKERLEDLTTKGEKSGAARKIRRARILLLLPRRVTSRRNRGRAGE